MCTVTYIPQGRDQGFILTSNRDERVFRPALAPALYSSADYTLCYPMDSKAGGSWIAMNNKGRLCCLLNGAFTAHQKQAHHTRSRGKILIGVVESMNNPQIYFANDNLSDVEPFTILTVDQSNGQVNHFSESIWDGQEIHFKELDIDKHCLWSSVTLYSPENRIQRKSWFQLFLDSHPDSITPAAIWSFHQSRHTSDNNINLLMEREGGLKTVSITQVYTECGRLRMHYNDLIEDKLSDLIL